jgi:hypothetical protein
MLAGLFAAPQGARIVDNWSLSGADRRKCPEAVVLVLLPNPARYFAGRGLPSVTAVHVKLPRAAWKWLSRT